MMNNKLLLSARSSLLVLLMAALHCSTLDAFVTPHNRHHHHHHHAGAGVAAPRSSSGALLSASASTSSSTNYLEPGDPVMLVGPGFLQLVLAKHLKRAGLKPIVVAPQKKLDSFFANLLLDDEIKRDSTIGMPESGDPYFGELKGVVFCAEDAILPADFVSRVLDFTHEGKSAFADSNNGAPARVICCLPVTGKVQKEKSNSWIPIFNNDRTIEMTWKNFEEKFKNHAVYKSEGGVGSILRFGSLFGGSYDGPPFLREEDLALEEGMYKMSLEQYRDLRERGFDRHRLGAQVLEGNAINPKPSNQEKMEKEGLKRFSGEVQEAFGILGGYPEIDRANRHTLASAITAALMKPADEFRYKEYTILSKAEQQLPTSDEWYEMFANPQAASWPDPFTFRPSEFGIETTTTSSTATTST
mmetsp:Transcript_120049/g.336101  ORF Transcript_120049/g.336101 Transcript_120049/m.336101 type:complete len:415 (-) Transcript_120049:67-1311(-)